MFIRLVVLALISVIAIGCGATPTEKPESTQDESQPVVKSPKTMTAVPPTAVPPTAVPPTAVPPTAVPTPEPISLSGTGDYLSSPFELQQGIMLLHATHNGSGHFAIQVLPEEGDGSELSINAIGAYEGTRAHPVNADSFMGLKPGLHRLEIKGDGDWEAEITQHSWIQGDAVPLSTSGTGDGIVGPVMFNAGTISLKATHNGSGHFAILVYSADGKNQDLIVNQSGEYDGSQAIRVQKNSIIGLSPGVHVVAVTADGEWKVDIGD